MHPNVYGSIIYNSQDMEVTYMPINRGKDKEDALHIDNGIFSSVQLLSHIWLFSHKKEQNNAICNTDGPRDCPTKSKTNTI